MPELVRRNIEGRLPRAESLTSFIIVFFKSVVSIILILFDNNVKGKYQPRWIFLLGKKTSNFFWIITKVTILWLKYYCTNTNCKVFLHLFLAIMRETFKTIQGSFKADMDYDFGRDVRFYQNQSNGKTLSMTFYIQLFFDSTITVTFVMLKTCNPVGFLIGVQATVCGWERMVNSASLAAH